MTLLRLQGIRGGVGTTALLAGLAYELHRQGQRVLLIDCCPENQLGLHFGLDLHEPSGWAWAWRQDLAWQRQVWELSPSLYLLPYGQLGADEGQRLESWLRLRPEFWQQRLDSLHEPFDWVLFDVPQRLPGHSQGFYPQLDIQVLCPDMACHVLLQRQTPPPLGPQVQLLVNNHNPLSQLQQDLMLLWQRQYGDRLLPLAVHQDEALAQALAHRKPAGAHLPDSAAAEELRSLAVWCLAQQAVTC